MRATFALADFAAEQSYDAILDRTALDRILGTRELLTYFHTVADRSPVPVVLLSANARRIPIDAVVELAAHPNIAFALLDSAVAVSEIGQILSRTAAIRREFTVTTTFAAVTARMARVSAHTNYISAESLTATAALAEPPPATSLKTRSKTVGFQILAEEARPQCWTRFDPALSPSHPAFAACAPQACYEVFAAWKDDDQPLAAEKNTRLQEAAHLAESTPGLLKHGCDLNGYFGSLPRLPHLPPTGDQRAALEHLMEPMRN